MDTPIGIPLILRGGQSDAFDRSEREKAEKKSSPLSYMYEAEDDLNEPVRT